MIRFDKVSFTQYEQDRKERAKNAPSGPVLQKEYEEVKMPRRGTRYSAGYDIATPFDVTLKPGESVVIPTGLKAYMEPDMWLGLYIRSSLGFKYGVRLVNSTAVIDADYSGAKNEGHLMVGIYNGGPKEVTLKAGENFAQGIFQRYYVTDDDDPVSAMRTGGFGSTNDVKK